MAIVQLAWLGILFLIGSVTCEDGHCTKPFSELSIDIEPNPVIFGRTVYLKCNVAYSEDFCDEPIMVVHMNYDRKVLRELKLTKFNCNGREVGHYANSDIYEHCRWFYQNMYGIMIKSTSTLHAGYWMCKYNNTVFTEKKLLNVTVGPSGSEIDYEPKIHRSFMGSADDTRNIHVEQGTRLVLRCDGDGYGVTQPVSYRWWKDKRIQGSKRQRSKMLGGTKDIVIANVNGLHDARYSCEKKNVAGTVIRRINVRVYCISPQGAYLNLCAVPPVIKHENSTLKRVVNEGGNVKFKVEYNTKVNVKYLEYNKEYSRTHLLCTADDRDLNDLVKSCRFVLKNVNNTWLIRVRDVTPSDYGTYTCLIHNTVGFTDFKIKLLRPGARHRVSDLMISTVTATSISMSWSSNPNVTDEFYIVEYRKARSGSGWSQKTIPANISYPSTRVTDLKPDTRYEFRIRGFNLKSSPEISSPLKSVRVKTKGINGLLRWIKRVKVSQLVDSVIVELPGLRTKNYVVNFKLCPKFNRSLCQSFNFTTSINYVRIPVDSNSTYNYRFDIFDGDVIVHSDNQFQVKAITDDDNWIMLIVCGIALIVMFIAAISIICRRRCRSDVSKKIASREK
ncbi:roundabout homolog 2-like [Tubulanus polymorphus]|uniref:roundabout homolog 2-like n=1 Tax=Tubulanus polymorphus TaxID=672921 RepID=UPI003DA55267